MSTWQEWEQKYTKFNRISVEKLEGKRMWSPRLEGMMILKCKFKKSLFLTIHVTNLRDFVTVNIITTEILVTNTEERKEVCLRKECNS